ncbi:sulfotransferase domain-containing protein (plasmid) [Phaeobacter inhibens]|uniref:sulfotransferase domain-containing protein n=1 Tax=Phaeobacter inhibens TaxID=221822 RepID=UPI0021A7274D|nr:sulfotransferase domain-containing protein [Phaeobacter inhibens]UWS06172.1 sulfotransferase domain-containing protein [Phaeobacter inhibens]
MTDMPAAPQHDHQTDANLSRVGPTIVGIGAQKCASTFIHAALGAHPDAAVSDPKELDFFSAYFDRGYQWYCSHFAHGADKPVRFEASPSYFYDPRCPDRLNAFDPTIKVVCLLRDPVARAYSNHLHEVIKGHIPPLPFHEGLANNPAYLEQGLYSRHLGRWLAALGRDRVLVMLAEEISADPVTAAQRVYRFAGLDDGHVSPVLHERRNESDRARLPTLRRALRAGGDQLRKAGFEDGLARLKSTGPVSALLRANSQNMRDVVPPLGDNDIARLRAYFADDLRQLPALLGRDSLPWESWRAVEH